MLVLKLQMQELKVLNKLYNNWIDSYDDGKLLVVDVNKLKFAEKPEDFGVIIEKIDTELYGLFK